MKKILLASSAVAVLTTISCGPSKTMKATESRGGGSTTLPATNYSMAECNRIDMSAPAIKGQISTYYNSVQLVATYLNMNLTMVPSEVIHGGTHFIQLFRWYERTAGSPQINQIPVTMYFVHKSTGQVSNPQGSDRISKGNIENIISSAKLASSGVTVANFFERHFVVLTGMDLTWDAVKFAYYNNASGTTAVAAGDVLLPAFYANPNAYMAANPIASLYALHPNYAYRTSGATEADYRNLTDQICAGFFGRIPASIKIPHAYSGFWGAIYNWFERIRTQFREALSELNLGKRAF